MPDNSTYPPLNDQPPVQSETPTPPTTPPVSSPPPTPSTPPPIPSTPPPSVPPVQPETPPAGSKKTKVALAVLALFFILASIPAAVFLTKQRQEVRKQAAAGKCRNKDTNVEVDQCDNTNHCDIAGHCNPACCVSDSDCDASKNEKCGPENSNGYCWSGKSCIAQQCLANGSSCTDNWQCCSAACSNGTCAGETKTCNSCPEMGTGYTNDPVCTAGGQACKDPPQNGFCCKKPDNISVCCYTNCECFEGQQGNCEDRGNGKIWLKGGITVSRIYKMVGTNVSCPFSSSNQINVKSLNYPVPAGGEEISLEAGECGQIEAVGYCGSCRAGCASQPTQTPTPPVVLTATPTPTHPTATPTPIQVPLVCVNLAPSPAVAQISKGDTITLKCTGTSSLTVPINHFEFRVTIGSSQPTVLPSATNGQITYQLNNYGCYKFECRACTSTNSTQCTAWGQAQ